MFKQINRTLAITNGDSKCEMEGIIINEAKVYHEPELFKPVNLCLADGRLNRDAVGWSRQPLHNCNLSGNPLRKKRWNYWCITTDQFLFSVTLSNIDYLGLAFIYFLDFETKNFHELTVTRLFGNGCELGNFVSDGAFFKDTKLTLSLAPDGEKTAIRVECPDFGGHRLSADLLVTYPQSHQTLNVVIPWSDRRFQFTSKQNTLPVNGNVQIGSDQYSAESGFACLDFGRGKWPFSSFWNWAGASGTAGEHTIGLNFGAGWTDDTGMNENGICVDGVLSKISEDLLFEYSSTDFMQPWKIKTTISDQVNVTFIPFFERVAKTDMLILKSEVHQMIGRFSGTIKDAAGKTYIFENIFGWAEEHQARW
jgi:hypothetical protein